MTKEFNTSLARTETTCCRWPQKEIRPPRELFDASFDSFVGLVMAAPMIVDTVIYFLVRGAFVILLLVMYYMSKIRSTFVGVPQLAKPWVMLQVGVASLMLGLVLDVAKQAFDPSLPIWNQVDVVVIFVSTIFFLLGTMMMKKAWTITASE